ncbi:MAG: DNA polymerase I, partial [Desulfobacteraceae bacterium]|nr:DNA polymerase I [Desulfobacteraceae bacterium]
MTAAKKIFLIDGSAFLYRAFHAIRNLGTSKGHPTNATFGFTRILLKLINDNHPEYAAVLFDVKGPTFRHEMYKEYKANRPPMPEELAIQIPDVKRMIRALNIPIVEKVGFEADDLVGTYADLAQQQGFEVVMISGDKDFIQLITKHCTLWDPMKDKTTTSVDIENDMGITPLQFIDILGLAGDSADNIPGVAGVGPKTAIKLIQEYGSIEKIYENLSALKKKKKLHENLSQSKEIVFLSRDLATIKRDIRVDKQIDDFKLGEFDKKKAFELFKELEFKNLAAEFAEKADKSKKIYKMVSSVKEMKKLARVLENKGIFAIDTETTSKDPMNASLVGISFSYAKDQAFYIPVAHNEPGEIEQPAKEDILLTFKPILENPEIKKVGQNIKYDYIVLSRYGMLLEGIVFDTMIASHLINPSIRGHSLDRIAMNLFGYKMISYEDVAGKGKKQIGFEDVAIPVAVDYAAEDADVTFKAYEHFKKELEENQLLELMEDIEIPLLPVLAKMEILGIKVDKTALEDLSKNFEKELNGLQKEIYALAGEEF